MKKELAGEGGGSSFRQGKRQVAFSPVAASAENLLQTVSYRTRRAYEEEGEGEQHTHTHVA